MHGDPRAVSQAAGRGRARGGAGLTPPRQMPAPLAQGQPATALAPMQDVTDLAFMRVVARLRRPRLLLHGILPRPRAVAAGAPHPAQHRRERHRPARVRPADRRGHPAPGAHGARAREAQRGRHRPQPGLPRPEGVPQERGRRAPARPGADPGHPRGPPRGGPGPPHRQDAHRLRGRFQPRPDPRHRGRGRDRPPHGPRQDRARDVPERGAL